MALSGFLKASEVIDEALLGVGDTERKRLGEAVMFFIRGYRDFNLYNSEVITERWVPVTATKTCNMPEDLMQLLWVGCSIDGERFTFTKSNLIVAPVTHPLDDVYDTDRNEDDGIVRSPITGYGAKGVNTEYYYNVDMERRRVVLKRPAMDILSTADRTEVLLGYVGTGVENLDNTYVWGDAANLLIAFIEWKLTAKQAGKVPQYVVQMKKEDYIEEVAKYKCLSMPSVDELLDAIYETAGQNVRR